MADKVDKVDPCAPLIGREFVAFSGNRARFYRLEDAAVRVIWDRRPTAIERAELERWAAGILDMTITSCVGLENEAENLAKWRNKQ